MQTGRHLASDHPRGFSHITLFLVVAYVLLLIYGTLFPFSDWQNPESSPWSLMWRRGLHNASKADVLTNLLVYMPLGLLLMRMLSGRRCTWCTVLLVTLASTSLSLTLEYLQAHLPGRVPSFADVMLNTSGGLAGALLALGMRADTAIGEKLHGIRYRYIHPGPLANLGLLTLFLWTLSQLSPLVPSIDLGNLRHGLKPLWHTLENPASLEWIRVLEYSLSIIAVGVMSSTLLRLRYRAVLIFTCFVSFVLLLKIPVVGRQLSLEALLGMVIGLSFTALMYDRPQRLRLVGAVCAILVMILASGLYVSANTIATDLSTFNWIPFRSHISNNLTGLIDILAGLWPFVALSYIARLATTSTQRLKLILMGALVVFPLMFALEWYQQYLPGRSPDITDAVIATIAWLLPWLYPALAGKEAMEVNPPSKSKPAGPLLPHRSLAVISVLTVVVIVGIAWTLDDSPVERPLDESQSAVLPAPAELPPVELPAFRYNHPRLPAPTVEDIARLKQENPAYLRNHVKRAADGEGKFYSAFVTAFVEPGSLNLDILYQRLIQLEITWRGHEQAKQVAVAYDWLYEQWTDEQRAGLQDKLASNAEYLIHRIREKQRLSPYNVYLYNSPFQALIATSLALYGDDPRGELIMRYTYDYWKNRVLPVWRQIMGSNGGWHEGGEYVGIGIGQAVYQVPAMWRKATGEDLFLSEPGIRGFLDFLVYRTRPDGTHFRWGDGAFFNRRVPDRIPLAIEYRHAAAYSLDGCPRRMEPTSWPWGPLPDTSLCDADAISRLPLTHFFDGIGMMVARSDWTADATYVTFKAGDNYWSHTHLDQGSFTVYRGGALAIDSGAYGGGKGYGSDHHMNYAYQTIAHNTISVTDPNDTVPAPHENKPPRQIANDGGQRRIGSGWGIEAAPLDLEEWLRKREIYHTGKIENHLNRDGLVAAVSDITPAYTNTHSGEGTFSHRTRRVERLWRTFGYDSVDDVVVIFDQLRTTQPEFRKRWLLHTIEPPLRTEHGFSVARTPFGNSARSGGQLEGHVLLPKKPQVQIVGGNNAAFLADGTNYDEGGALEQQMHKRKRTEPGAWRIELSPGNNTADTLFLIVILPSSQASSPTHQIRLIEETDRLGCEIVGPKRTTYWWFSPGRNGLDIEVISPGGASSSYPVWSGASSADRLAR
jgi:VanZ family protein